MTVNRPVLLIIDPQQGFISPSTSHLEELWSRVLTDHRRMFDTVVATRFVNLSGSAFHRSGWHEMGTQSPDIELVEGVRGRVDETFDRSVYPVPGFTIPIEPGEVTDLYIAGVDTDACVMATALNLYTAMIRPIILADLCGSSGGDVYHRKALDLLRRNLGPGDVRNFFH